MITLISYALKNGHPGEVPKYRRFSCLKLINPYNRKGMRTKTGLDPEVQALVSRCRGMKQWSNYWVTLFGKSTDYTLGFYCSGGRHRSVAVVEILAKRFQEAGHEVKVIHRDLGMQAELPLEVTTGGEKDGGSTGADVSGQSTQQADSRG